MKLEANYGQQPFQLWTARFQDHKPRWNRPSGQTSAGSGERRRSRQAAEISSRPTDCCGEAGSFHEKEVDWQESGYREVIFCAWKKGCSTCSALEKQPSWA